ncbi:MAG: Zn-ribbon domain-containing OB-fold protein [Deltaproteobacteria bacterium]|nr:MAG: Zn-ribbon domain-containing OB-fold protein [Deltaproteobacteria bacterium]
MTWNKPLPNVDEDIAPFWEACKRHEFALFRCKSCGAWYWPAAFCRNHKNEPFYGNMEWAKASGRGRVFAFNIHYRPFHTGFKDDVPYVYALIELDEGPIFSSNIIGCKPQEVKIGMPVEVVFEDISEKFSLPKFRPIG